MEFEGGEGGDGGASVEAEKMNSPEGEPKVKRKMKTPSQLEILERTYAMEAYPSEAFRAELSVKLGLSDRQLQMWFCHRRLKDRKAPTEKRQTKQSASPSSAVVGSSVATMHEVVVNNADMAKDGGSGLTLFGNTDLPHKHQRVAHKVGTAVPRISIESPSMRRFYEPPLAISEQRAIQFVEAQLGEPLREDGPILGMEFDPLPPGAFGAPIVASKQQRPAERAYDPQLYERVDAKPIKIASSALQEYQFLPEKPFVRNDAYERAVRPYCYELPTDIVNARVPLSTTGPVIYSNEQVSSGYHQCHMPSLPQQSMHGVHFSPVPREVDVALPIASVVNANLDSQLLVHPLTWLANMSTTPERQIVLDQERLERKRKTEEARIAKEVEAHEKRIKKELEKQDLLRKKREEQIRKEMERQDRERLKEEDRLLREKQREEERYQRELRREMERRDKFLQKEYIRAEKIKLKEQMRKEKDAARLKAANDKAAARRIAKESTELIEDERLELMDLATSSKRLPSILALDSETLQNLDLFKDKLPEFPPESVHLKRPFRVQPWTDSEENVGNLLMVWRFLIAFADVLGLWPFTLDEFTQSLHDSDPRLLGDIHIALLRSIIKDIIDVAGVPATTMAANQNPAGNPVGGHPHIVEGAYSWGFDLLSWQHLLTPLTWPEVLRQFALSAGFGPKLKQNIKAAHPRDEKEDNDGADTISNLRSGVAAENALSIMQERGFSNPRKSRHRLTPGTVKYAAFYILSLEGSKGLSILEVADKIQRSGLRDLTTSKTPEASISAALSRDTKLFERTAPSTYCVRSPYRKDPVNADEILSEARDKIRAFQNGSVEEEAGKEDLGRDQESESDVADDPDVDDMDNVAKLKEASDSRKNYLNAVGNSKSSLTLSRPVDAIKSERENGLLCAKATGVDSQIAIHDVESIVSDECVSGEPWVQGLTEGEYADLSTEERVNALVALIVVANEGNAIRNALEERLEAANALKKQMWAEAQIDKRRMKDDHISKFQHSSLAGNRSEPIFSHSMVEHNRRSPLTSVYVKNESSFENPVFPLVDLNEENCCTSIITEKNHLAQESFLVSENMLLQQSAEKSRSQRKALIGHQAEEVYVYRSLPLGQDRRRNRYWQFRTSPSRNDPGSGKIYVELRNSVWRLIDSEEGFDALLSSLDIRGIREYHLHSMLLYIGESFKETARKNVLHLKPAIHVGEDSKKKVPDIRHKLESYSGVDSPMSIVRASYFNSPDPSVSSTNELENHRTEENDIMERYKDFKWLWKECFDSNVLSALKYGELSRERLLEICKNCHSLFSWEDNHCPSCHRTYKTSEITSDFAEHVSQCERKWGEGIGGVLLNFYQPPRIRLLKAQLAIIEASIPSGAFKSVWSDEFRKSWGRKLHMASTAEELLQTLTLLEGSINREFLSANYEITTEMLSSCEAVRSQHEICSGPEAVAVLPWIPSTTPAVALRLMELDLSIYYTPEQKSAHQKENSVAYFMKSPASYPAFGNLKNNTSQSGYLQQDNRWADPGNGCTTSRRGRGRPKGPTRTRCGKFLRKNINSRDDASNLTTTKNNKFTQLPLWKGRSCGSGESKRGRRLVKNKQEPRAVEESGAKDKIVFGDAAEGLQEEEWNFVENASSSERSEFDNVNRQASPDEYDNMLVEGFSGGVRCEKSEQYNGSVGYELDREDDDDDVGYDDDYNYDDDGDNGMDEHDEDFYEGYINSDYNEERIQSTGEGQVGKVDDGSSDGGSSSSSSEYSY